MSVGMVWCEIQMFMNDWITIGAKNITCIIKCAGNSIDVTRCNTLHQKVARNLFDATVLAFQVQSCEDMTQSIAALESNWISLMRCDALKSRPFKYVMFSTPMVCDGCVNHVLPTQAVWLGPPHKHMLLGLTYWFYNAATNPKHFEVVQVPSQVYLLSARLCRADLGWSYKSKTFRSSSGNVPSQFYLLSLRLCRTDLGCSYNPKHFEVVQEMYRVKYISSARGSAERIWGDFFILAWQILGNFLSEFWRPKSSAFLPTFTFSNPKLFHADCLLTGETNISQPWHLFQFAPSLT